MLKDMKKIHTLYFNFKINSKYLKHKILTFIFSKVFQYQVLLIDYII